ncbi:MAG: hypothetical protein IJ576_00190, partial [Synergistaceae bacterium]|nr:hypothetical protein [Synergistaceae bacterium]
MRLSFKRVVSVLLLAVFMFGLLPPLPKAYAADGHDEQYDPLHTMLALNMAIVSIHRIITTQDRIVLNQEYDNIINKLALGNIESDYDITGLYSELMNFITGRLIRQEDMKRIQARYNRREQRQIVESVSGIRAYGGSFWSWLGRLAVSCVTQYFSYQNVKDDLHEGLDEELWLLKKDDIEQCNELQVKLLNSSWNLLRQYRLPDEYRLTQDSLDGFYSALNEPDTARRLRRLQVRTIERNFQAYPPYWFYRARAAQELNQGEEAAKCYAKFNEIWRPVLRRDPYKLETEKYAILTLAKNPEANKDEIKKHLAAIQENLADNDWSNNLFAGVVYFLLGGNNDKSEAIRLLEDNVIAGLETDVSGVILAQMEAGRLTPESLPNELRALVETLETKKVEKYDLSNEEILVGACIYSFDDVFMTEIRNNMKREMQKLGGELEIVTSMNRQPLQNDQ